MLFSTEMVKAILGGSKTMTRRMTGLQEINENPDQWKLFGLEEGITITWKALTIGAGFESNTKKGWIPCPYGRPGDMLWVRETFGFPLRQLTYKASWKVDEYGTEPRWKPSIHMPKDAARIWLEITDIGVERLQNITESDAKAEGVEWEPFSYKDGFMTLWQSINGHDSWSANPWVWVVSFKVLSTTGRPAILEGKEVSHV